MTAYTTRDAVRLALRPIVGDADGETAGGLDDSQVDDAILEASSRIDTYLAQRYQTPVAPIDPDAEVLAYPDPVGYFARDYAAYLASLTFFRSQTMAATEPIYLHWQGIITELTAIRDGKQLLNLPPATTGPASDAAGSGVVSTGPSGLFDIGDTGWPAPPLPGSSGWGAGYGW